MSKFIIEGDHPLRGEITVAGNKNAALPIIAATVLTDEECLLENVPDIRDVHAMLDILRDLGKRVEALSANSYRITGAVRHATPSRERVQRLRASILYLGALLGKTGEARIAPPGGCVIGRRHVSPHFEALRELGAAITVTEEYYEATVQHRKPATAFLTEASVTATENALLFAAASPREMRIENAACEPHVADLARVLEKMGAGIQGIGSNRLRIVGAEGLRGFQHRIVSDHIETGTFAILAACTGSEITIRSAGREYNRMVDYYLRRMGVDLQYSGDGETLRVRPGKLVAPGVKIQVGLWPNFPTDLMSPMICLATQAEGTTLCHDWMFESRMFFVDKLIIMGANITLCDPHRALVTGPTRLRGQNLTSPDIRAGIALVIAALSARRISIIDNAELVDRGYENIVGRLQALGAKITRER